MIIKKLIIYGYGKWIDTEFDINRSFHLFYGENEAGKSTLMSFIHSIFFGFPTRHSSSSRYEPKESSRYGGKIIIEDPRFGEVSIERVLGKVTGDVVVQLEDGTTANESFLNTLFHGKSRFFYESIYSFDLKGIEDIQALNEEQLNRFFLSIGALGHEKYLKQSDHYHSQASKLFKPMGRKPVINQMQTRLKEKQREVDAAKEKNASYMKLVKDDLEEQNKLEKTDLKLTEATGKINYLVELSRYQDTIEEIHELKKRINDLPDLSLPADGLYQLKQFNSDSEEYQNEINELQEGQKALQHQYKPSKELVMYQQNEEALSVFEKELDNWEDKAQELQLKKKDLSNLEQKITELKLRENISFTDTIPESLSAGDRKAIKNDQDQLKSIEKEIAALEEKKKLLSYRIDINSDRIDKVEPELVPLSEFNELKELVNESKNDENQKKNSRFSLIITILIVIALIAGVYFLTFELIYGLGALAVAGLLFLLKMNLGKSGNTLSQEERNQLYEQRTLRNQWKELLAAIDDDQSKKEEVAAQLDLLKQEQKKISDDFDEWKAQHNYSRDIHIYSVLDKAEIYDQLREHTDKENALTETIERSENKLNEQLNTFEQLFTRSFIAEEALEKFREMKNIFREIKKEQRELKEYIKKTEAVQHEINYYVQKMNEVRKNRRSFMVSLNTEKEDEVYELYSVQKEKEEKRARLSLLLEKLPDQDGEDLNEQLTDLDARLKALRDQKNMLESEQKDSMKKIMAIEMQIRRLEDGGTYTELLQEYENEKSAYQEIVDEWSTLKTAAGMIEKTLHYAKEDKLPHALTIAESYFSFLTNGKYQRLMFDEKTLFIIDSEGNKWQSEDLSRGTVEPLYISLRLAFIEATKETIKFPIIIDDPFVNLDTERLKKMYELLTQFDKEIQLIYFSFDQRIHSFIDDQHCVYLSNQGS